MAAEQELIQRSKAGDREAFARLIQQYGDRIFRLAQQVCVQAPQEAEGVHQDTFVTALEKIQQFESRSQLGTWLYRIAANLCWMRLRARGRAKSVSLDSLPEQQHPDMESTADAAKRTELQQAVFHALEALPTDYRMVVTLRDIQGLSTEETAVQLELSAAAVKSRLHRGRHFLREKLKSFDSALTHP